jgi:hypothetical protein
MLSDVELYELKDKMRIQPTLKCIYKDHLKNFTFKPEEAYIINLADEANPDNFGTHYCLLYSAYNKQLPNKPLEYFWFDSYGAGCPTEVNAFTNQPKIPHSDKNIQGKFSNSCGFYCLAMLFYLTTFKNRLGMLFCDAEMFLQLFDDTKEVVDTLHNEVMLKEFFKVLS